MSAKEKAEECPNCKTEINEDSLPAYAQETSSFTCKKCGKSYIIEGELKYIFIEVADNDHKPRASS